MEGVKALTRPHKPDKRSYELSDDSLRPENRNSRIGLAFPVMNEEQVLWSFEAATSSISVVNYNLGLSRIWPPGPEISNCQLGVGHLPLLDNTLLALLLTFSLAAAEAFPPEVVHLDGAARKR